MLLTNGYKSEVPMTPLFRVNLFARVAHRIQGSSLFTVYQFIMKGHATGYLLLPL